MFLGELLVIRIFPLWTNHIGPKYGYNGFSMHCTFYLPLIVFYWSKLHLKSLMNKSIQRAQTSVKAADCIARIPNLDSQQHDDPDHTKNFIYCLLHHCRSSLKISSKSARNFLGIARFPIGQSAQRCRSPPKIQSIAPCIISELYISSNSVHNFLSNVANRQQTNKQTNKHHEKHTFLGWGNNKSFNKFTLSLHVGHFCWIYVGIRGGHYKRVKTQKVGITTETFHCVSPDMGTHTCKVSSLPLSRECNADEYWPPSASGISKWPTLLMWSCLGQSMTKHRICWSLSFLLFNEAWSQ